MKQAVRGDKVHEDVKSEDRQGEDRPAIQKRAEDLNLALAFVISRLNKGCQLDAHLAAHLAISNRHHVNCC